MGDPYWKYAPADGRQQQPPLHPLMGKRPRSDYDVPGGRELPNYFPHEGERGPHLVVKDSDSIGASYDRYLRGTQQIPPYGGGMEPPRPMGSLLGGPPHEDPRMMGMGPAPGKGRDAGPILGRHEIPLPPDASNTLFVEGLPSNCSRREVAHIFRPFVGYKEARLVTKESRHSSGDPLVLCFVDFESPAAAATAKDALQGYKFDEHDRESVSLRLQFARYPGVRAGGGGGGGAGGGGGGRPGGGGRGRR